MGQRRGRGRGRIGGARGGGGRGRGRGGGDSVGKFLAPHTGRQAGAIANAQAGAEYNPQIREERGAVKGSRKREADLGQWYAQLAADYQGASSQGAAALQAVQDRTSQQLAEASGRSTADLSKLSADDEAFAKLVGGPKDTEGLARIAEAGAAAPRSWVALSAPVAQEQANFVGALPGGNVCDRMQGIEERRAEQRRRGKLELPNNRPRPTPRLLGSRPPRTPARTRSPTGRLRNGSGSRARTRGPLLAPSGPLRATSAKRTRAASRLPKNVLEANTARMRCRRPRRSSGSRCRRPRSSGRS